MTADLEPSVEIEVIEPRRAAVTLFDTTDPEEALSRAHGIAVALQRVLAQAKLTVKVGGNAKPYVLAEGWTCLGSLVGVFPRTVWTRKLEDGWEARVEAVTLAGAVVGAAESQCTRSETEWGPNPTKGKPKGDYALRSMAQTRAMSKALRMPLGFIVVLAGFEATPADEMPVIDAQPAQEWTGVPDQYTLTFGKYKGQTIAQIAEHDRSYVGWLGEKAENETAKAAAKAFLRDEDIPF